jgi:capsular exopolysaccharide synthesis family protein
MAQGGKKVILIDANLRWPGIHKRMNLLNKTGLSSLLLNKEIAIGNVMQKTKTEGLFAITSGDLPPNPAELLWSKKMVLTLEKLKESADMVVMDTPPVLLVADTVILGPYADGVLLVLQPGKTSISATRQAIEQLQQVNTKVVGVILVNVDLKSSRYHYFYRKNYGYLKNEGN